MTKTVTFLSSTAIHPLLQAPGQPLAAQDDMPLVDALAGRGIAVAFVDWMAVPPSALKDRLTLVRSTWDYTVYPQAFASWMHHAAELEIPLLNNPVQILANIDKRYLLDVATRDIPVIPTTILQPPVTPERMRDALQEAFAEFGTSRVVIKPVIGAGARETHLLDAQTAIPDDLPADMAFLLQPFLAQIQTEGEWSLIFFDGTFSHAVCKRPAGEDFRVQEEHGGETIQAVAPQGLIDQAFAALQAGTEGHDWPAYARVDGLVLDGIFTLMELELIEPSLYFEQSSDGAARFAEVIERRLDVLAKSGLESAT